MSVTSHLSLEDKVLELLQAQRRRREAQRLIVERQRAVATAATMADMVGARQRIVAPTTAAGAAALIASRMLPRTPVTAAVDDAVATVEAAQVAQS